MNLRDRAIRLLARREHSRAELAHKLRGCGNPGEVSTLLDDLEREDLLSDERYVEAVTRARAGRYGSLRLRQELRERGVAEEVVESAVRGAREQELPACRTVWEKKFGQLPTDTRERYRQFRFLSGRGFSAEVIASVLGRAHDD